jgi:hypothetical protein
MSISPQGVQPSSQLSHDKVTVVTVQSLLEKVNTRLVSDICMFLASLEYKLDMPIVKLQTWLTQWWNTVPRNIKMTSRGTTQETSHVHVRNVMWFLTEQQEHLLVQYALVDSGAANIEEGMRLHSFITKTTTPDIQILVVQLAGSMELLMDNIMFQLPTFRHTPSFGEFYNLWCKVKQGLVESTTLADIQKTLSTVLANWDWYMASGEVISILWFTHSITAALDVLAKAMKPSISAVRWIIMIILPGCYTTCSLFCIRMFLLFQDMHYGFAIHETPFKPQSIESQPQPQPQSQPQPLPQSQPQPQPLPQPLPQSQALPQQLPLLQPTDSLEHYIFNLNTFPSALPSFDLDELLDNL